MKKITSLVVILATLFFSCTKDTDSLAPDPTGQDTTVVPPVNTNPTDSADGFVQVSIIGYDPNTSGEFICYNANLTQRWKRTDIGNSRGQAIYADGVFYLACSYFRTDPTAPLGYIGYDNFVAVNAQTGNTIWSLNHTGKNIQNPDVRNDTIFCGILTSDNKPYLAALDARTGTTIWEILLTDKYGPINPLLSGNTIYFSSIESDNNTTVWLSAFDINTRTVKWKVSTGATFATHVPPFFVAGNMLYCTTAAGSVKAFDIATGAVIWQRAGAYKQPLYCGGRIYAMDGNYVFNGFNKNTGATEKTFPTDMYPFQGNGGSTDGTNIFLSGYIYNTVNPVLASFNPEAGSTNWKKNTGAYAKYEFEIGKNIYEFHYKDAGFNNASTGLVVYDRISGTRKDSIIMGDNRQFSKIGGLNKNGELIYSNYTGN